MVFVKGGIQENTQGRIDLFRRVKACGGTGVILADIKLGIPAALGLPSYRARLMSLFDEAAALGLRVALGTLGVGWSPDAMWVDPNLAEAQPVASTFEVIETGKALVLVAPGLRLNGSFSNGTAGWSVVDKAGRIGMDTPHLGVQAVRVGPGARTAVLSAVLPTRAGAQYHVSWWARSDAFIGAAAVRVSDTLGQLFWFDRNVVPIQPTQPWTRYDITFIARGPTTLTVGVPGQSGGDVWFESVEIEETALINTVRRGGTPLELHDPVTGQRFAEGLDFAITGPSGGAGGTFRPWHEPPTIKVLAGSALVPRQRVELTYHATTPVYWNGRTSQNGVCLSDPDALRWVDDVIAKLVGLPAWGVLAQYDELRHGFTCSSCTGAGFTTPGELLAWHIARTFGQLRGALPAARQMIWSDMVGGHNARAVGFHVDGSWAGCEAGVPEDAVILNWERRSDPEAIAALRYFAGRGLEQWIAGYYDTGDGAAAARQERGWIEAAGVEVPAMVFTTWRDDYREMESYIGEVLK